MVLPLIIPHSGKNHGRFGSYSGPEVLTESNNPVACSTEN
jgi:hypothetical protein